MVIIQDITKTIKKQLKLAKKCAKLALHYKAENKAVADMFAKMTDNCLVQVNTMHDAVTKIIKDYQAKGNTPPADMMAFWKMQHDEMINETAEIKRYTEMYKM